MSVCTQSAWIRPSRSQKWDGPDLTPARFSSAMLPEWKKPPRTEAHVKARAARMKALLFRHMGIDPRDDDPGDVVGVRWPFRAGPRQATNRLSPRDACRRYLREWRSIRRRSSRRA